MHSILSIVILAYLCSVGMWNLAVTKMGIALNPFIDPHKGLNALYVERTLEISSFYTYVVPFSFMGFLYFLEFFITPIKNKKKKRK